MKYLRRNSISNPVSRLKTSFFTLSFKDLDKIENPPFLLIFFLIEHGVIYTINGVQNYSFVTSRTSN